ncbi:NTP transferase domain-containing protein [Ensifer sp. IC4062]|nr:NTP transferase domain-containing protein [Ensifer sp. IC4062]
MDFGILLVAQHLRSAKDLGACMSGAITGIVLAGGYGGRFYPFTKTVPKELLPVSGVPTIHWVLRECVAAGVARIKVVRRADTDLTEAHFAASTQVDDYLRSIHNIEAGTSTFSDIVSRVEFLPERPCKYGTLGPFLQAAQAEDAADRYLVCFGDEVFIPAPAERTTCQRLLDGSSQAVIAVLDELVAPGGIFGIAELEADQDEFSSVLELWQKPHTPATPHGFPIVSRLVIDADLLTPLRRLFDEGESDLLTALTKIPGVSITAVKTREVWGTVGDPASYLALLSKAHAAHRPVDIVDFYRDLLRVPVMPDGDSDLKLNTHSKVSRLVRMGQT